jgi:hypothetical protein
MSAFSSTKSGVNEYGTRMASSRTNLIADAVRREMRRAACGSNSSGLRESERARGRKVEGESSVKRTARCCCWAGSTDCARSKFGVRRRLYAALPEELDAREWLCWVRWNSAACCCGVLLRCSPIGTTAAYLA